MALSTRWTRLELRTAGRRELMDLNGRWFSTTELDSYLADWQNDLQDRFEFLQGTATLAATSLTTHTLTAIASDILRPGAVYWNDRRLVPLDKVDLDALDREWRANTSGPTPYAVWQNDIRTMQLWPPPGTAGTLVLEYPRILNFTDDASTMSVPAWTRYSAANYCAWRAFLRQGPNHDLGRAARYRAKYLRQCLRYATIKTNHLPTHMLRLMPGGNYEHDLRDPIRNYYDP